MHRRGTYVVAALGAVLFVAFSVTVGVPRAWCLSPDGDEFAVNSYTTGNQINPDIAPLEGGGFVVVWESFGQDESRLGVYGQMFDADGDADSDEFEVTEYTTRDQRHVSVAGLPDGGFVVVWASDLRDGAGEGVFGQVFDDTADPLDDVDFRVNNYTAGDQSYPRVAVQATGFVVIWESEAQDGDAGGLFGQRFDFDAQRVGTEFQVNSTTTDTQRTASVAATGGSGFWVLWTSDPDGGTGQDGSQAGIFAQRFAADASRIGPELQVNTITEGDQVRPTLVATTAGGFTAVWESRNLEQGAASTDGIAVRRYDVDLLDDEAQVNTFTSSFQEDAAVAGLPGREMLVVWESQGGDPGDVEPEDTNRGGVFARQLSVGGTPVGTEFQINSYTTEEQDDPRVAALEDGRFAVVWESTAQDKSLGGVYAQLYSAGDLCGDADDDGRIEVSDALRVLRASNGVGTCAKCQCDADGDDTIETTDALAVLRAALGFTGSLACDPC